MRQPLESGFRDSTKVYAKDNTNVPKAEDRKVRFDSSAGFRDRKYEGYSVGGPKGHITRGRKDGKEGVKDKKLDEEFIHNLHQHIYYLEMQLKLLYSLFFNLYRKDKDIESKKGGLDALFRDGIPLNENFLALKNRYKKEQKELDDRITSIEKEVSAISSSNAEIERKIGRIQGDCDQLVKQNEKDSEIRHKRERE